jgi:protoporphyrinogen oxidase
MVGLVSALRLSASGAEVTIFERDARVGGLAASFEPDETGDSLERFYHHVFRTDARFAALCEELGLASELMWGSPETSCYFEGEYRQLDSAVSLLRFGALPIVDRLRLAGALAFLKLVPNPAFLERWVATTWLKRVAGRAAYRIVFEPLFVSKFGRHADSISLAWFWARIHDRTADLGYVRGGFDRVYRGLAERVRALGGAIVLGTTVRDVSSSDAGLAVSVAGDDGARTLPFDVVLSTLPLRNTSGFAELPPAFIEAYGQTAFLMARCVVLALDRPLTGRYWVNICDPDVPFMVVVEHTQLVPSARYGNKHIVYLGNYGESFPACDTATLIEEFTPYLRRLNAEFSPEWITEHWQFVAPGAQPVITPGYRDRLPPLETPMPGLFLANIEQVYPHDRGQNYAIELAETVSAKILREAV